MMESQWWTPSFKDFLTAVKPRLIEAWGLNLTFDNGLCALLTSGPHKGGDFIEFSLFFERRGGVLKASPQDFIRWRSGIRKWRRSPVPHLRRGDPLQSELEGILQGMGCNNSFAPQPAVHYLKRPNSGEQGPVWYATLNTRWDSGSLAGPAVSAGLDDMARFLARIQEEAMAQVGALAP